MILHVSGFNYMLLVHNLLMGVLSNGRSFVSFALYMHLRKAYKSVVFNFEVPKFEA